MKIVINTKTHQYEHEQAFRQRFKDTVSFNGELTSTVVKSLDPDCVLQELNRKPPYDGQMQMCYLSDVEEVNGKLQVKWIVKSKSKAELSELLNTAVENMIDAKARSLGWVNQDRLIGYIGDSNPTYDREARYMKLWRSQVWDVAVPYINNVLEQSTSDNFKPFSIAGWLLTLPAFSIPENF